MALLLHWRGGMENSNGSWRHAGAVGRAGGGGGRGPGDGSRSGGGSERTGRGAGDGSAWPLGCGGGEGCAGVAGAAGCLARREEGEIGRAPVRTHVTNAHLVCRLLAE